MLTGGACSSRASCCAAVSPCCCMGRISDTSWGSPAEAAAFHISTATISCTAHQSNTYVWSSNYIALSAAYNMQLYLTATVR